METFEEKIKAQGGKVKGGRGREQDEPGWRQNQAELDIELPSFVDDICISYVHEGNNNMLEIEVNLRNIAQQVTGDC